MEIFAQEMSYQRGDFVQPKRNDWDTPRLCVATTRKFFALPTKPEMEKAQQAGKSQFVVSLHDRYKKQGVAIRIRPNTRNKKDTGWWGADERKVQVERSDEYGHIGWANIGFYDATKRAMLKQFDKTKKETLYVVIETI